MRRLRRTESDAGFTVVEIAVVLGIVGVMMAMAGLQMIMSRPAIVGDGAMRVVVAQMRTARELAISERRYMRVTFTAPNTLQIIREEFPGPATTVVATKIFEGGVEYTYFAGTGDTPDAFGAGNAINFGAALNVKFTPDGTLVNQDGGGANGSVFIGIPNSLRSARAVTVLGSTGRIRGYRWDGRNWKLV